jgi:hypothetical protein
MGYIYYNDYDIKTYDKAAGRCAYRVSGQL